MVQTAFMGEPIGWGEPAYEANTICRSMVKKWMILTHPFEKPKNIKGFVNLSFSMLQSGQTLVTPPTIDPIILNVVRNVMRPRWVMLLRKVIFVYYATLEKHGF